MKKILALFIVTVMLISMFGTVAVTAETESLTLNYVGVAKVSKNSADTVGTYNELGRLHIMCTADEWDAAFQYDLSQIPSDQIVKKVTWRSNYSVPDKLLQIKGFDSSEQLGIFTKNWNDIQTMGYNVPYNIRSQAAPSDTEKETITAVIREADPEKGIAEETTTTTEWAIDMTTAVTNAISKGEKYLNFVVDISAGYSDGFISMWWTPQPRLVIETEPAPKEKILNFVGSGRFTIGSPDSVETDGNWYITTENGSTGSDSYFQYDLSSLPENEVITKATWKALYSEGKKNIEIKGFNTSEKLGNFTKSYNALLSVGYNNPYEIRTAGPISDTELATVSATDGTTTTDYLQWNIDMTQAVQNAVANNQQYLSFVVNATAGYAYGCIPRYWSPYPTLVVETQKVASLKLLDVDDGKITTYNCVGFDIEAEAIEGEEEFESVVLTVTDANNETQTYDEPVINGNSYKWSFSSGLSEGTYTAVVTATDAVGKAITATATIVVEPTVKTLISKSHFWAKSGAGDYNFTIEANPSYFQHQFPEIPDGAVVTSAKWYVRGNVLGGNYQNGRFVLTKLNIADKLSGYSKDPSNIVGSVTDEAFVTSDVVTNIKVTTTINDKVDTEFAVVDITEAVRAAYENDEAYFGYMAKLSNGYCTVSASDAQYQPFIAITYDMDYQEPVEPVEDHILSVVDGTATASVTVNEGSAVLIIAVYDGDRLLDVVMDDTIEDSQLTISLTNSTQGVTFKSFVWKSMDTLTPLLPTK